MKTKFLLSAGILFIFITSCKKDDPRTDNNNSYPTSGLVSYFNFDNNLADQLGNTPDGTNNNATFTEGKAGQALTFNGENQSVQFSRKTFRNGNNISVSVWVKKSSVPSNKYFIICSDFGIFTNNNLGMAISVPGTDNANGSLTEEVWTHLVGTYDGTDIKAYINGVLASTTNHPGDISGLDVFLTLGRWESEHWGGSIDDLFIYNKTLSQSEVDQLYAYH